MNLLYHKVLGVRPLNLCQFSDLGASGSMLMYIFFCNPFLDEFIDFFCYSILVLKVVVLKW